MKQLIVIATLLATPALADDNTRNWYDWVEICTTGRNWRFSEAERLKICLLQEQRLRDQGRCMYSPGVIGQWDGKHCR